MTRIKYLFKIKATLVLTLLIAPFSGCNEWIDIEPENAIILQEFWKTSEDVMSVLGATYNATRRCSEKSLLFGEIRADFVSIGGTEFSDYERIGENDISTSNGKVGWYEYYNAINLANTVMHFGPLVQELDQTLTDDVLKGMKAEMLFLRALNYFYLVRIWKEVPLVLNPTISDTVDFYLPKSPEPIIIKQLISDLKTASALASPEKPGPGRASKYAIQALLADVLLWNENYAEAGIYCDSIINSGRFALETNADWFKNYYPGNSPSESLFELHYDDKLEAQENPMYETLLGNLSVDVDRIAYDEENDIRICANRGPIWKFIGTDETGSQALRRSPSERDANFIFYRYSEILLMKAETLAEAGNLEEANFHLREIAERAGTSYTPTFAIKSFRTALLTERGREFALEGKRWFEVLRFAKRNGFEDKELIMDVLLSKAGNAQEIAIMRAKVIDTMSYYLPIHLDEIQNNKNLVQNPFYDR